MDTASVTKDALSVQLIFSLSSSCHFRHIYKYMANVHDTNLIINFKIWYAK